MINGNKYLNLAYIHLRQMAYGLLCEESFAVMIKAKVDHVEYTMST